MKEDILKSILVGILAIEAFIIIFYMMINTSSYINTILKTNEQTKKLKKTPKVEEIPVTKPTIILLKDCCDKRIIIY